MEDSLVRIANKLSEYYDNYELKLWDAFIREQKGDRLAGRNYLYDETYKDYQRTLLDPELLEYMVRYREDNKQ